MTRQPGWVALVPLAPATDTPQSALQIELRAQLGHNILDRQYAPSMDLVPGFAQLDSVPT